MEGTELRPSFTVPLEMTREVAIERIREGLVRRPHLAGRWRGKGRWAELFVAAEERRIWSPHLSVRVDRTRTGSELFARFAPDPEIWTLFMFLYFGVAFAVLFGATFAYVQWVSDEPVWAIWAVWIGIPALIGVHLLSTLGQRLGRDQMRELQEILWDVLEEIEPGAASRAEPSQE